MGYNSLIGGTVFLISFFGYFGTVSANFSPLEAIDGTRIIGSATNNIHESLHLVGVDILNNNPSRFKARTFNRSPSDSVDLPSIHSTHSSFKSNQNKAKNTKKTTSKRPVPGVSKKSHTPFTKDSPVIKNLISSVLKGTK